MCEAKSVDLIDDEQTKHDNGSWICPKSFSEQFSNQDYFYDSVAKEIKYDEVT
jgi:hypothetical protein